MRSTRREEVFVDLCTQVDYLDPAGAAPVQNARLILPTVKHLMAFARLRKVPTLSCVDARRPADAKGAHQSSCIVGTPGQRKVSCTLLPDRVAVDGDNCLCVSLDLLQEHRQAIFCKEHRDPFTNPKFDRMLTEMPSGRFVVFGVSLEETVRLIALGLLLRHRQVTVVRDACGYWDQETGEMSLRQLAAKGCELVTTQELFDSIISRDRRSAHMRPRLRRRRSVA